MRTQRRILLVVSLVALLAVAATVGLILALGRAGVALVVVGIGAIAVLYRGVVGPWQRRWGASPDEVQAPLPGDELLEDGTAGTTRATTIAAPAAAVWPWLVQLGYGRAGWYSYDWLDNDGVESAWTLVPEWQHLEVGDRILMTPTMGFTVREVDPGRSIVSQAEDGTTWCLALFDLPAGRSRLISRFRARPPASVGAWLWTCLVDPGSFVMERRMLLGIRERAEARCAADVDS